jgi:iron complex transport system permease protein
VILSVRFGAVSLTTGEVFHALLGDGDATHRYIVGELRLPRAILGILVGGGLALAGAVFQALLRNPLAEPYILGISGEARRRGRCSCSPPARRRRLLVRSRAPPSLGALLAIVLVFAGRRFRRPALDVRVLLLSGVVVGAFFSACIAFDASPSADAPGRCGAPSLDDGQPVRRGLDECRGGATYTIPAAFVLLGLARALNLMAIGEETAGYLGTDVEQVKRIAFAVASLIAASGVAFAGVIGFVGLIVPHGVRLVMGSDHRDAPAPLLPRGRDLPHPRRSSGAGGAPSLG